MKLSFYPMTEVDWPEVQRIYSDGIATGIATFDSAPSPNWHDFSSRRIVRCCIVARDEDSVMAGWGALTPVSYRPVYRGVAEASIYIAESHRAKRVGDLLLRRLIELSEGNGFWTLQASTFPQNHASIALQKRHGFHIVGIRQKIGKMTHGPMADQWCDTLLLERRSPRVGLD